MGQNKNQRVKNQYGYFKGLLGKPPKIINGNENINTILDGNELNIKAGPFTRSEYENVRKQIKENKATGPDSISPNLLKLCEISDIIISFGNKILINNEKLTQLGESDMIPIPKKGDFSLPGISTTAHTLAQTRLLLEGVKEQNLKTTLVFINFKKGFDNIQKF